ncbi:hypothetical protein [Albibacterium sp.]|uniref:hypothetical protein n=1 Tax=Albibacterium sp. TaxID=2952885 RepID=UPI002B6BEE4B|nr:hypothetical protein [Albibacterium sp.]HLT42744.1 hypothetical protein [Sphingobacteriaceae bacterium]HUH18451.1 hypothetical protein [Albibacterium sp.]
MIQIRTFRAPDDPEACEKFIVGHKKLLEIFGITKITSNRQEWVDDYNTNVILVEDPKTKIVYGGARLQVVTGQYSLPIEDALGKYDNGIYEMVKEDQLSGGTCELCGLWNSREVAGMGIGSYILSRVGAAIASQLSLKSIFVLCAPITVRMGKRVGAVVEESLGDKGLFFYPKDDLIATAMRLRNIYDLSTADPTEREKILSLRENFHQFIMEKGPKGTFEVEYNLKIPNLVKKI